MDVSIKNEMSTFDIGYRTLSAVRTYICKICNVKAKKQCLASTYDMTLFVCFECVDQVTEDRREEFRLPLELCFVPKSKKPTACYFNTQIERPENMYSDMPTIKKDIKLWGRHKGTLIPCPDEIKEVYSFKFVNPKGIYETLVSSIKEHIFAFSPMAISNVIRFLVSTSLNGTKKLPEFIRTPKPAFHKSIGMVSSVSIPTQGITSGFTHMVDTENTFDTAIAIPPCRRLRFDKNKTEMKPFYPTPESGRDVKMMNLYTYVGYKEITINGVDCQVVSFEWTKTLNAYIILPRKNVKPNFFIPDSLYKNSIIFDDYDVRYCDMYIPRFSVFTKNVMNISSYTAGFELQFSFIDTRFAKGTKQYFHAEKPTTFRCDHPFVFIIGDSERNVNLYTVINEVGSNN